MYDIRRLIVALLIFSGLYYSNFFVVKTMCKVFNHKYSVKTYTFPILAIISLSIGTQTSYMMGKKYYSNTYYLSVTYLGILVNCFLFGILYRILDKFIILNKQISIFIDVICPIFISIYGLIKAKIIFIEKIIIKIKKYKNEKPTKICHLSDIHLGAIYQKNFCQKIINIINNKIKPDIIVITGDLMDSSLKPNIQSLKPFEQIKVPILYITGNHEETIGKYDVLEVLKKTNIIHIGDIKGSFFFNGINFYGIDYDYNIIERLKEFEIKKDDNNINLLLSHVPNLNPKDLNLFNLDIFLCGHTHGGQNFPLHLFSYFSSKCFKGLYKFIDKYVFVSSGVGTSLFPMRIGSCSTIHVISVQK